MHRGSQIRFDPEKPQILDKPAPAHKVSSARPAMRDKHLTTIPEGGVSTSDIASISSNKELHSSLKVDKLSSKKVPTAEKIVTESGERRSTWELLMRKFSEDVKVRNKCRLSPSEYAGRARDTQHFITGSSYKGTWNILGMDGYGTFKFPSGVEYEGEFFDSCFHGEGVLKYPNGVKLFGKWEHGVMKTKTLVFADGVQYDEEDWKYCQMPDRRFTIEHETALRAGTESYMTASQPTKLVPPGFYDTGDGFLHPESNGVYKYDCITDAVRFLSPKEKAWVLEHCRTNPETPVGPKEGLYERWMDPTQPDDISENASLRKMSCGGEEYSASSWSRMSLSTSFGRKPFIKFDPQTDAEMDEPNESNVNSQIGINTND